jgi:hypothetical protein
VEEIEAMLMEIPFMRDYITTKRQYEETKAALESLTKKVPSDEHEDDYSTSWSKRRRLDEKLAEGGDGAGESEGKWEFPKHFHTSLLDTRFPLLFGIL